MKVDKPAATASRDYFQRAAHPTTGLTPEYSDFDGTPWAAPWRPNSTNFVADAWRTAMNWSVDWTWWQADPREPELSNRLLRFFGSQGINTYASRFTLDGKPLGNDHSSGLVAMNAVAGLAAEPARAKPFTEALWNTPVPRGRYRYYDGMLYLLAMLHCSGEFRIWAPVNPTTLNATASEAKLEAPTIRIKAGGNSPFKDSSGNVWQPDQGFADGETTERPDLHIANTKDSAIYCAERYSMTRFSQALPNGKYMVKLHFAETYQGITGPGQRVFSFNVEGREFKDFDIWAKAGGDLRAYVETVPADIANGQLDITFTPSIENPQINGIEIIPAGL